MSVVLFWECKVHSLWINKAANLVECWVICFTVRSVCGETLHIHTFIQSTTTPICSTVEIHLSYHLLPKARTLNGHTRSNISLIWLLSVQFHKEQDRNMEDFAQWPWGRSSSELDMGGEKLLTPNLLLTSRLNQLSCAMFTHSDMTLSELL